MAIYRDQPLTTGEPWQRKFTALQQRLGSHPDRRKDLPLLVARCQAEIWIDRAIREDSDRAGCGDNLRNHLVKAIARAHEPSPAPVVGYLAQAEQQSTHDNPNLTSGIQRLRRHCQRGGNLCFDDVAQLLQTNSDRPGLSRTDGNPFRRKPQSQKLNCGPTSHQCGNACVPKDKDCEGDGTAPRKSSLSVENVRGAIAQKKAALSGAAGSLSELRPVAKSAIAKETTSQVIGNLMSLVTPDATTQNTVAATVTEVLYSHRLPKSLKEAGQSAHKAIASVREKMERVTQNDLPELDVKKALTDPKVQDLILGTTVPEAVFWAVGGVVSAQTHNPSAGLLVGAQAKKITARAIKRLRDGTMQTQVAPQAQLEAQAAHATLQAIGDRGRGKVKNAVVNIADTLLKDGSTLSISDLFAAGVEGALLGFGVPSHIAAPVKASSAFVAGAAIGSVRENLRDRRRV